MDKHKGKVHGELPKPEDLPKYDKDELKRFLEDLKESVKERIQKNSDLGPKGGHGDRQADEQALIAAIQRLLGQ